MTKCACKISSGDLISDTKRVVTWAGKSSAWKNACASYDDAIRANQPHVVCY
jgi:hypothetical protein